MDLCRSQEKTRCRGIGWGRFGDVGTVGKALFPDSIFSTLQFFFAKDFLYNIS